MGDISEIESARDRPAELTTAILILVTMSSASKPLTTYEIGLKVTDNHIPARPVSVIIKTLARDGYVIASSKSGKRIARWALTERGISSLKRRNDLAQKAILWLRENPNMSKSEIIVDRAFEQGNTTMSELVMRTGLGPSAIRTAIRRTASRKQMGQT